jgi:hypothetical protein
MRADSTPASPHSPMGACQSGNTSGSGSQHQDRMEVDKAGEVNLKMPDPASDTELSCSSPKCESSTVQLGRPFIQVSDETRKDVDKVTSELQDYRTECCNMQSAHQKEFQLLLHEIKHYYDLTLILNQRTGELLKNHKQTASTMYQHFDLMEFQQQHAINSAHALKDVLLHIHHDLMSLDDYYVAINELLRGGLTLLAGRFDKSDTCLIAFKSDMEGMFHHWNLMAPSPLYDGTWLAKLTSIIAQMKQEKRMVDLVPKPSSLNMEPNQAQAEGSCMHTKGKEVAGKKSFTSGKGRTLVHTINKQPWPLVYPNIYLFSFDLS